MVVKKDGCVVDSRETQRRNPKLCVCVCVVYTGRHACDSPEVDMCTLYRLTQDYDFVHVLNK